MVRNYFTTSKKPLIPIDFAFKKGQLEQLLLSLNIVTVSGEGYNKIIRFKQNAKLQNETKECKQGSEKSDKGLESKTERQGSRGLEVAALQYEETSSEVEDPEEVEKESPETFPLAYYVKGNIFEEQDTPVCQTTSVDYKTSNTEEDIARSVILLSNSKKVKLIDEVKESRDNEEPVPPSELGCVMLLSHHLTSPGLCRFREVGCKRLDCIFTHRLPEHLTLPAYCWDCSQWDQVGPCGTMWDHVDNPHKTRPTCITYPKLNRIYKEKLKEIKRFCQDCQDMSISTFKLESQKKDKVVRARNTRTSLQAPATSPIHSSDDNEKLNYEEPRQSTVHDRLGQQDYNDLCWHFQKNNHCPYGSQCLFIH